MASIARTTLQNFKHDSQWKYFVSVDLGNVHIVWGTQGARTTQQRHCWLVVYCSRLVSRATVGTCVCRLTDLDTPSGHTISCGLAVEQASSNMDPVFHSVRTYVVNTTLPQPACVITGHTYTQTPHNCTLALQRTPFWSQQYLYATPNQLDWGYAWLPSRKPVPSVTLSSCTSVGQQTYRFPYLAEGYLGCHTRIKVPQCWSAIEIL